MKSNKLCILLSHLHVKNNEQYKFDIVNFVLDFYTKQDTFIILVGHGEAGLPRHIAERVNDFYWEPTIDISQIGTGHPKFCIKGYELAMKHGFKKVLKMRADDLILKHDIKAFLNPLLGKKRLIISEQTNLQAKMIGDLFHYGELSFIHNLWTSLPWNYNIDGLKNLYSNAMNIFDSDHKKIKDNFLFIKVEDLEWVSVTDSWNIADKKQENLSKCYWGFNKYNYMGGF